MMMNLFSSFDPTTYILNLNWMSTLLFMIIIPSVFWMVPSRWLMMYNVLMNYLYQELKIILSQKINFLTFLFISIFTFILMNNFMGLFPYTFTSTSHLTLTLSLALPIWLSLMFFGWIKNTNHMFTHLVPQGTPLILMPFMVCIESISNIIRPITLTVRLSANMIAGHLLLTLLGNSMDTLSSFMFNTVILIQGLLLILEFSVAIIQAYVFTVLTILYSSEVY
uniref:ATP synthase F0 subunit 6 n=1 Tax=Ophrygonius sp. TaxID=2897803 RepID=UPI001EDF1F25|nr:ATP synthase F0 subunit 6 [Ophrygonius sp.]UFK32140.1 ATP synthase F0 subunit 6 [Ophrygonius sp.]UIN24735.1 ATP synthase F0 subunit 6 [Ophrygonius sp.]